jgi:hypothetical protein
VRSYWWHDAIHGLTFRNHELNLSTAVGRIRFATFDLTYKDVFTGERLQGWGLTTNKIERPPSFLLVNTPLSNFGFGFAGSRDVYGMVAVIPLWFTVVSGIAAATAPWIRYRKAFSLRTLLIATTLIAVVLGLVVLLGR